MYIQYRALKQGQAVHICGLRNFTHPSHMQAEKYSQTSIATHSLHGRAVVLNILALFSLFLSFSLSPFSLNQLVHDKSWLIAMW